MIELHGQLLESENQLVALWASYRTERLALGRDLHIVPGHDWNSFLAQIQGEPAVAGVPGGNPLVPPATLQRP